MDGNTITLLNLVAKGARDAGAEVRVLHPLQDEVHGLPELLRLPRSTTTASSTTNCTTALQKVKTADAVVVGSPIYMMQMTGPVKNLYDRLFPLADIDFDPHMDSLASAPRRWSRCTARAWRPAISSSRTSSTRRHIFPGLRFRTGGQHRVHRRQRPRDRRARRRTQDPRVRGGQGAGAGAIVGSRNRTSQIGE